MLYKVNVEFNCDHITINEDQISIGIKSKPVKGKANKENNKKASSTLWHISIADNYKIRPKIKAENSRSD